ncbi:MAG: HipA N-terminal domain-containing protein [Ignavibacteria bacterium]|nr:HipA N-terminal domain-containing protein [Ignavibacteria bacterium]
MRSGKVYVRNTFAGIIAHDEDGFAFKYDAEYLNKEDAEPVSLTLPKREPAFRNEQLFAFFDGLIPEGWLLDIAEKNWKVNRNDRMELLLTVCNDCIGNVSIVRDK